MTAQELRARVRGLPLIASVQADSGTPLDTPETIARLALASSQVGVSALRLQGVANITAVQKVVNIPVIGLIKREYVDSSVYITPTLREIAELLATGCEVIALDCTARTRPHGTDLREMISRVRNAGRLVMADCDSVEAGELAVSFGAEILSTTLSGYTGVPLPLGGPDIELVRAFARRWPEKLIFAEGRFATPLQAQIAVRAGADAVVIGGALNDPIKQTRAFASAVSVGKEAVGAVDLGGTWIRFGTLTPNGELENVKRVPRPESRDERLDWIRREAESRQLKRIGIGSGGTIDPSTLTVTEAKPIIPDHLGTCFAMPGLEVVALNDGLATAWAHGTHRDFAGNRVATLALGTGVGCGLVDAGRIWLGPEGQYPRINDARLGNGLTIEEALGGAGLTDQSLAQEAAEYALELVRTLFMPDVVVLAGGVGLAPWLNLPGTIRSPYGDEAGLMGAGRLAQVPPVLDRPFPTGLY